MGLADGGFSPGRIARHSPRRDLWGLTINEPKSAQPNGPRSLRSPNRSGPRRLSLLSPPPLNPAPSLPFPNRRADPAFASPPTLQPTTPNRRPWNPPALPGAPLQSFEAAPKSAPIRYLQRALRPSPSTLGGASLVRERSAAARPLVKSSWGAVPHHVGPPAPAFAGLHADR